MKCYETYQITMLQIFIFVRCLKDSSGVVSTPSVNREGLGSGIKWKDVPTALKGPHTEATLSAHNKKHFAAK